MQVNVNFDLTLPLVAPEVEEWHHDVSLTGFASFPYRSVVEVLFQVISDLFLHLSIKGNLHEWISTTIHLASQFFSKFFVAIDIICTAVAVRMTWVLHKPIKNRPTLAYKNTAHWGEPLHKSTI